MTRRGRFLLEGALVWLLMPIAAIADGALRDLWLAPLLGERAAEILSLLALLIFIYAITAVFLGRAGHRRRSADLWALGHSLDGADHCIRARLFRRLPGRAPISEHFRWRAHSRVLCL